MRSKIEKSFADVLKNNLPYKFITNDRRLLGTPDVVFHDERLIVFFHGCYWHSHHCRTSKHGYQWKSLLKDIRDRDLSNISRLQKLGYETLIVWECEWRNSQQKILEQIKGRLYFARHQEVNDRNFPLVHLHQNFQ